MNKKLTKIFDNIGLKFILDKDTFAHLSPLNGFNNLNHSHVGYFVPYIARNIPNNLFETGVGEIKFNELGEIVITRVNIVKSSNNNEPVNFSDNDNEFYIFANQSSFDSALNNVILLNTNKIVDLVSAIYLIDTSNEPRSIELPTPQQCPNIVLEFKLLNYDNNAEIKDENGFLISILSSNNSYIRLVSVDNKWLVLNSNPPEQINIQSNEFSILSNPIDGAEMYWDTDSQRIFIGADTAESADTIIPTTGNYPFIVNNQKNSSDFIVYGSGSLDRNLFFSYDGKVGLNIPSGARPSTIFHIVNTVCKEALRIDNRTSCYPASITLYHKPSSSISNGDTVGQINLAGKNSLGNSTNYAQIESIAINPTANAEKGRFQINVVSGVSGVTTIATDINNTILGYENNKIIINNGGNLTFQNANAQLSITPQSNMTFSGGSISTTGSIESSYSLAQRAEVSTTLKLSSLSPSGLLTINQSGYIVNSPVSMNAAGSIKIPSVASKILHTLSDGSITGIYSLDDYFRTEQEIIWNKYSPRNASICLRQVTFISPAPIEEFSIGDQIVISLNGTNFYRTILEIEFNNSTITGLLIDQMISDGSTSLIQVSSVTKGGYLTISKNVDEGIISDATNNVISIRPSVDTVFNSKQKDINFVVYGLDDDPALLVRANTGRMLVPSGMYANFATGRSDMFSAIIDNTGVGLSNQYSSANYNYDNTRNTFSGFLSSIGSNGLSSYYGTYDQNGNAAEWIEKPNAVEAKDPYEFIAGGSYLTEIDSIIGSSGLKSIESLPRYSGYGHVGFRVASLQGIVDDFFVSASTGLNLAFTSVDDPKNIEDRSPIYVKNPNGSNYSPQVLNNLGVVNNIYRIGKYEITNNQYCKFLNIVAKLSDRGLYDNRMSSDARGGIVRTNSSGYEYFVKSNMRDKPVVFVDYLSSIRFINWMHNGSMTNINESDIDFNLNTGAYTIYSIGANSFNIVKESYQKYWLPNLNEWHKAAYYKPVNSTSYIGTSTVSIKRDDPYLIGSGISNQTKQPTQVFANLSVSGWLYADHIMIGDGTIMSSLSSLNLQEGSGNAGTTQTITESKIPSVNLDAQWDNRNSKSILGTLVSCSGCSFNGKPLRLDADTFPLCTSSTSIANNNVPWWCDENNNGPGWFI